MSDTYKTITSHVEGIYKIKGSKFLSFAIPVEDADQIKSILAEYRKQFFDARHVCYAYMLGVHRNEFRSNDDGEPSGTAGRPILGQINSNELTNILIIVVRYFGGVLLGTGGLVSAYKLAAMEALANAEIVEKTIDETIAIQFDYLLLNDVMRVVKEINPHIVEQTFDNECRMQLSIRQQQADELRGRLANILGLIIEDANSELDIE